MKIPMRVFFAIVLLMVQAGWSFAGRPVSEASTAEQYALLSNKDCQRLEAAYIDNFDKLDLLNDPAIRPHLRRMLGKEFQRLEDNLTVRSLPSLDRPMLYITGNARHEGLIECGFLGLDLSDGAIYTVILTGGKNHVYGKEVPFRHLPRIVRQWILIAYSWVKTERWMPRNLESYLTFHESRSRLNRMDRERLKSAYLGTYDNLGLLNAPVLRIRLKDLLGKELTHLERNLDVPGRIGISGNMLVADGIALGSGGQEHGFMGIDLSHGRIHAALLSDGKIHIYGIGDSYEFLP